jgi:hypothetical protein
MARFGKNIPFSKKEFEEVKKLVVEKGNKGLKTLYMKMEKALVAKEEVEEFGAFKVGDAMRIAKANIGDNLNFAPVMAPLWYVKMNRYIKGNGITPELVEYAAAVADRTWKKPIYFDTFLYSVMKLASQELKTEEKRQQEFRGWAEPQSMGWGLGERDFSGKEGDF